MNVFISVHLPEGPDLKLHLRDLKALLIIIGVGAYKSISVMATHAKVASVFQVVLVSFWCYNQLPQT